MSRKLRSRVLPAGIVAMVMLAPLASSALIPPKPPIGEIGLKTGSKPIVPVHYAQCADCGGAGGEAGGPKTTFWYSYAYFRFVYQGKSHSAEATVSFSFDPDRPSSGRVHAIALSLELTSPYRYLMWTGMSIRDADTSRGFATVENDDAPYTRVQIPLDMYLNQNQGFFFGTVVYGNYADPFSVPGHRFELPIQPKAHTDDSDTTCVYGSSSSSKYACQFGFKVAPAG